jgi:hypothetical protein
MATPQEDRIGPGRAAAMRIAYAPGTKPVAISKAAIGPAASSS